VSNDQWEAVRRDRLVKNELAFRDYNNRRVEVEEQAVAVDDDPVPFVCECGSADCIGALMITIDEYEAAHSAPDRFTVKSGHIYPEVELAVEQHEHYWVVEKHPGEMPLQ
jgi:5-bromo-4-chloroindolyl phosphate hydrolysis protein